MKKLPIPPLVKHAEHEVVIKLVPNLKHAAKIHCVTCDKFVMWLGHKETELALEQGLIHEI